MSTEQILILIPTYSFVLDEIFVKLYLEIQNIKNTSVPLRKTNELIIHLPTVV